MNLALETRESATLRRKDTRPADRPVTDLTLEKREREGFNNYLEGEKIVEITVDSNRVPILPVYYYMRLLRCRLAVQPAELWFGWVLAVSCETDSKMPHRKTLI